MRAWLAGRSPDAAAGRDPGFLFNGTIYTDPRMLADAFRRNRDAARARLAGGRTGDPLFLALRDWASALRHPPPATP